MKQALTILALLVLASPALAGSHQPGAHFIENWDMDGDGAVRLDDIMTRRGDIFVTFDADENGALNAEEYTYFDAAGWVDVDQATLRHKEYDNIWSLGDVMNAPNAKTAAAACKQAPTVADNIVAGIAGRSPTSAYDGYGSCPLTVERGKIVLAEFGYGGVLKPSFPSFLLDGTKPSRAAWFLKETLLPPIYWKAMLKGKEWMAKPEKINVAAE